MRLNNDVKSSLPRSGDPARGHFASLAGLSVAADLTCSSVAIHPRHLRRTRRELASIEAVPELGEPSPPQPLCRRGRPCPKRGYATPWMSPRNRGVSAAISMPMSAKARR